MIVRKHFHMFIPRLVNLAGTDDEIYRNFAHCHIVTIQKWNEVHLLQRRIIFQKHIAYCSASKNMLLIVVLTGEKNSYVDRYLY